MDKKEEEKLQKKIDKLKEKKTQTDANEEVKKQLKDLTQKVEDLTNKRTRQQDILPGAVKQRHIDEGVRFIRSGLEANLPTNGENTANGSAFYWCTDSFKLKIWTGTTWKSATLS